MTVQHVTGDLFTQTDLAAIGHGVNLHGVMGSGIAPRFKAIWPTMYTAYRDACQSRQLTLGGVLPWQAPSGVWIYNLATQAKPGRNADLTAIEQALTATITHMQAHNVPSLGLPRIGAGIGGLRWLDVSGLIEEIAGPAPVLVRVVSLPDA